MSQEAPKPGVTSRVRVIDVIDGDTVTVEITRTARVRLLDCWSPETRTRDLEEKRRGLAAKEYMKRLTEGKDAILHIPTDEADSVGDVLTFGRVLGRIYIDGVDISEEMCNAGHATKEKE